MFKKIPKWLKISVAIVSTCVAFVFAAGGIFNDISSAMNIVPKLQASDKRQDIELQALSLATENKLLQAKLERQQQITELSVANSAEHANIKSEIIEIKTDVKQINSKTDKVLDAIVRNYYKEKVADGKK